MEASGFQLEMVHLGGQNQLVMEPEAFSFLELQIRSKQIQSGRQDLKETDDLYTMRCCASLSIWTHKQEVNLDKKDLQWALQRP